MTAPARIRLSRAKGWKMPDNTLKVDRTTPWGNPFRTGLHGTAEDCVRRYTLLLLGNLVIGGKGGPIPAIEDQRTTLKFVWHNWATLTGKNLACWCQDGAPCHAHVLLELANNEKPNFERFLKVPA